VPSLLGICSSWGTFMESADSYAEVQNVNFGADRDLTTDPLLPSQYYGSIRAGRFSSEQRLMLAVLIDAINLVLQENRDSAAKEASSWIFASGVARWVSFDFACDALGLHPEWLRERLSALVLQRGRLRRIRIRENGRLRTVTFRTRHRR
jgi:hypothetical protein